MSIPVPPMRRFVDHLASMLAWLDEPGGRVFREWLVERRDHYNLMLRTSDSLATIHRAQGALEVVEFLFHLRDALKQEQSDKQSINKDNKIIR